MTKHSRWPHGCTGIDIWLVVISLCLLLAAWSVLPARAQTPQATPAPDALRNAPPTIGDIRKAAANASGVLYDGGTWHVTGTSRLHGADQAFEMFFDNRFRFWMATTGALPQTDAFDGATCWTIGPAGIPHQLVLEDCDVNRLVAWTMTGSWAQERAPVSTETSPAGTGELAVLLTPRDGVATGTLLLDHATYLPKSLRYWTDSGDEIWTFSGYRRFGKRMLPTHIVHRSGQQNDAIEITSADRVERDAPNYRMPRADMGDTEYDSTVSSTVEVKRVGGYLFVRPRVDGQDVGWFFLDTGADSMCIDPGVAKKLNLSVIGGDTTAGVVGVVHLDVCRATTIQLGPVTIKRPVFLQLDLASIAQALNIPIAGICGYDLLARAVLDIDPRSGSIRVSQAGTAVLPAGAKWTKIGFSGNTPCLECRFAGDHRGFFSLDTGSNSTVDFFTPAVDRFHLLTGQDGTTIRIGGAGGTAESRQGKIEWFELGGTRIRQLTVGFQRTRTGVFASPYRLGNIGMGLMGKFRLLLDYTNEQIAFVPQKDD